jgi:hypothetical protein
MWTYIVFKIKYRCKGADSYAVMKKCLSTIPDGMQPTNQSKYW